MTIMNKIFIHVKYMNFLDAFDKDSDQTFNLTTDKIILYYNYNENFSKLTMIQKIELISF